MRNYIQLSIFILFSCTESGHIDERPRPRPVFSGWDNFYCYKENKENSEKYWTILLDSEGNNLCKPEEIRYILHLSVPVSETVSCESQAENSLRKHNFLKEFAEPSDPLNAKEEHSNRMASEGYRYYRRRYCALQKLEKMGEFDTEKSGVIGCCPFDSESYSCGEGWFSKRKTCACAVYIKNKSNLQDFYDKLEKYECEPKE